MKKIFTLALCLGIVATSFASCTTKRYNPDDETTPVDQIVEDEVEIEEEIEIPEEQKDFEVDLDMNSDVDSLKIKAYKGEAEELELPSVLVYPSYGELPVTAIGEAAFLGNETLKKVTVPEGVKSIGTGAFQSCSALTDVVLPEGLESIGDSAFESSAVKNINIPSTVTKIGKHAFSTKLNPTPWYASLTAEKVIVGDGILLKYNGRGDTEFGSEVKHIAYYAFQSPGAINVKFNDDLESFDSMAVYETEGNYLINFLVPYKSNAAKLIDSTPYTYTIHGIPVAQGNPFKWEFNSAKDLDSWYGGHLDISYDPEGAIHGKPTGVDYQFCLNDAIYLPAEDFKTMVITMKHNTGAAIDESRVQRNIQVYFNNGSGLSETASVKIDALPTSSGEYVEYTLDMGANDAWKDIITYFRIDTLQGLEGDFYIKSVEFLPEDPAFDFNTLLKPITKYVPSEDDGEIHKYKFEDDESKALAWTMEGFEYSYAPIKPEGDNNSIHGILDAAVESSITSPVINVPEIAYRKLIIRLRGTFDEMTAENKDNYKLKVYFDNGNGFGEAVEANIEQNSGEEKIEYTFDIPASEDHSGVVKQIKVVLPEAMGGEFWIDKVEFVPENKVTRADFVKMLYVADGGYASGESIFFDVVVYDKYCDAVIWATANGLVQRAADNMFNPDKLITMGEYADMMNKYAAIKGVEMTFEAGNASAPVYEADARAAIEALVNAPAAEEAEEAAE